MLNLVHLDIKPLNIMYSKEFNKIVFIDFGISSLISQTIGYKTMTNFMGTVLYCSQEMSECLI
jgi:serine/threonine protein kinase